MNPSDYQDIRLLTDTAGQFFGGGPFQGPYGNGANVQASGQVNGALDYLWRSRSWSRRQSARARR